MVFLGGLSKCRLRMKAKLIDVNLRNIESRWNGAFQITAAFCPSVSVETLDVMLMSIPSCFA